MKGLLVSLVLLLSQNSWSAPKTKLLLYNWPSYMDPQVLEDFEKETGIKVVEDIYDSNEGMRAKLMAGANQYDVVVPSGHMVQVMIREKLLAELNLKDIPNLKNIDKHFKGLYFDPQGKYSAPYLWGTTGIGYREDLTPAASWGDLLDPKKITTQKGKISLLDDPRETLGAALQYLGFSVNSLKESEISKARDLLIAVRPSIARFDSETYGEFLVSGDMAVVMGWSGGVYKASVKNPKIRYILPKEGGVVGVDSFVILKTSTKQKEAHQFINYILRPEVAAKIVNKTRYPSANDVAKKFILPEVLNNPVIYPPESVWKKMEWLKDIKEARSLYERAWKEVKLRK